MSTRTQERWKTIRTNEGDFPYEVSDQGRVRSLNKGFEGKILKGGEGPASLDTRRRLVWLTHPYRDHKLRPRVDKLVAVAFLGDPEPGDRLVHRNGCDWDDRAENLLWESTDLPSSIHTPLPLPGDGSGSVEELTRETGLAWQKVEELRKAVGQATDTALLAERALARATGIEEARKASDR